MKLIKNNIVNDKYFNTVNFQIVIVVIIIIDDLIV